MSLVFTTGIRSSELNTDAEYLLFVEGEKDSDKSIDPIILGQLFENDGNEGIRIKPLRSSSQIQGAAKSLSNHFKKYYFLIDRDYLDDDAVEKTWKKFLTGEENNLLIWRRKAIENYFIDPDYLKCYTHINHNKIDILKKEILNCANQYLFMNIANHVIMSMNRKIGEARIDRFDSLTASFSDVESSIEKIKKEISSKKSKNIVENAVSDTEIKRLFNEFHNRMTDGEDTVEFGKGEWMNLMDGKPIFNTIINNKNYFDVPKEDIQGDFGFRDAILKDLVKKGDADLPEDFVELRNLINKRMQ